MKIRRFIFKTFKIFIILLILTFIGGFLYIKLSPKITINSANNIVLYDKDNNVFFEFHDNACFVKSQVSKKILLQGRATADRQQALPS